MSRKDLWAVTYVRGGIKCTRHFSDFHQAFPLMNLYGGTMTRAIPVVRDGDTLTSRLTKATVNPDIALKQRILIRIAPGSELKCRCPGENDRHFSYCPTAPNMRKSVIHQPGDGFDCGCSACKASAHLWERNRGGQKLRSVNEILAGYEHGEQPMAQEDINELNNAMMRELGNGTFSPS